jgi:hypoxanthine phosphoribosyltransferase
MVDISFVDISAALDKFILPDVDFVIGIAEGGLVPASLAAYKLGRELKTIKINLRDENNNPRYENPKVLQRLNEEIRNKKILLVDDVSVTGKTLEAAKSLFPNNAITTFAMKGKADLVLFPEIKECVNWPWKIPKQ